MYVCVHALVCACVDVCVHARVCACVDEVCVCVCVDVCNIIYVRVKCLTSFVVVCVYFF